MKINNMKSGVLVIALVGLSLITGCATGNSFVRPGYKFDSLGKVAAVVESPVMTNEQKKEVGDLFSMNMLMKGYDVIDRGNLDQIFSEVEFQNESGVTSTVDDKKLNVHNISALVVVNISDFGDNVSMTAKMMDTSTGTLLWMGEGTAQLKSGIGTIGGALTGAVLGGVAGNTVNTGARDKAAIAGGVAGAVAGNILEPNQAQLVRKVIIKVTEKMPILAHARAE